MKRLEFLLIALMAVCALTLLNACVKKNGGSAVTSNESAYGQSNGYNNSNASSCSSQMVYQYQEMLYVCNNAYSWNDRRQCRYLIESFINQYPQVYCNSGSSYNSSYSYKSTQNSKSVTISSAHLRKKLRQIKN
jgi:hypothetical protein